MDRDIFWGRIAKLREIFIEKGLDGVWIRGPENRRYLSGFKAHDTHITESAGSLLIGKNYTILMTDSRYELEAKLEVPDFEIKILKNDILKETCRIIMDMGIKKLGIEEDYLSISLYKKIKREFEKSNYKIELITLNNIVENMREIKDEHEIKAIKKAAQMVCRIMDKLMDAIKIGVTEKEIEFKIRELVYKEGAEDLSFPPIVASGSNSALPHAVPGNKKLDRGEPIIIDMGVKLDGYCSDITRTVFIEKPKSEFERIYSIVKEAQNFAIDVIRPGMKSTELDSIARNIIKKAGFGEYFGHGLGHGVGLAVHEKPKISMIDITILRPGMVITIEPGIYIPNKGGVRLEEMVLIKEDGVEVLTKIQS